MEVLNGDRIFSVVLVGLALNIPSIFSPATFVVGAGMAKIGGIIGTLIMIVAFLL